MDKEKPQSRHVFGLESEEIVGAPVREYGKEVHELKRRKRGEQNEARMVAIYLSRQLGGHKHGEIGKVVGLDPRVASLRAVEKVGLQFQPAHTREKFVTISTIALFVRLPLPGWF